MRLFVCVIFVIVSLVACQQQDSKSKQLVALAKDTNAYTNIQWIDSVKNIGTVESGKKKEITFRFKNTGTKPLFIISAVPGCGCTVADYPQEAIAPGAEGIITAGYQAPAGTNGEFRKNITVTSNTRGNSSHIIFFYGTLKNEADEAAKRTIDTATLEAIKSKELKRNLLLKPAKN
jgi:hypothetical protein